MTGLIRVVHPFPSALDAVAASTIALIAGAQPNLAIRLGLGMLGLQFAIGAANDVADAASDAVGKPGKPIPAGNVTGGAAVGISATAAGLGLLVAATVGLGALVVGTAGLADGLIYDLRLKRTPLAWMPFAAGVGLLPMYAWWGARGSVPAAFLLVLPLAVVAGASLALANAYVDIDRDSLSGVATVATYLGGSRTLLANKVLMACVQLIAMTTTVAIGGAGSLVLVEAGGSGLGWLGVALFYFRGGWSRSLGWEVQAVGILILGAAWLTALNSAGFLSS
jgi:4-hydroxybenzoate polyprenyltransferase